jgi:hypothetical protein
VLNVKFQLVYDTPVLGTKTPLPSHLDIAIVPFGLIVHSEYLGNVPKVIGEVISKMSIHYLSMHDDAVLNDLGSLSY